MRSFSLFCRFQFLQNINSYNQSVHVRGFTICDIRVRVRVHGHSWTSMSADTSIRLHRSLATIILLSESDVGIIFQMLNARRQKSRHQHLIIVIN